MMSGFESWWYASKYMQVVFSSDVHKQIALDGWNAAIKHLHNAKPELYMAKNLHNKTYATHPNKSECEVYLAQSGLKNDGIEAKVIALYERPTNEN